MSAFLGPIHYWLYNKIQLQEELVQRILETSNDLGWGSNLGEQVDAACGAVDARPLEECIDQSNIHGSLQEKIKLVEVRLAFLVTELTKEHPERLEELEKAAYRFGQQHSIGKDAYAKDAFQALSDRLIDGMPCDHVNMMLEQDENEVVWRQTQCVHQDYWQQVDGDVSVYYVLRSQMIKGMLEESGLYFYEKENGVFEIRGE